MVDYAAYADRWKDFHDFYASKDNKLKVYRVLEQFQHTEPIAIKHRQRIIGLRHKAVDLIFCEDDKWLATPDIKPFEILITGIDGEDSGGRKLKNLYHWNRQLWQRFSLNFGDIQLMEAAMEHGRQFERNGIAKEVMSITLKRQLAFSPSYPE